MRYDPETGRGVLFVQYIDTFFKRKTEACGYPDWGRCREDEERYGKNFYADEGIRLGKGNKNESRETRPGQTLP